MIGQLLLHYRVVEKIGEGGQGTVYKVIDTTLDRPAVIKVLPPALTDSASNLARFEREAKLASSLDHPNICTIFGLHKVGDIQFIAMQYVEGRNVRQLVGGQPLDLRQALAIAIQVTDALAAAHSRGIVHRDIKARNVMVKRSGTVKILDFGLAKLIESPHTGSSDPQLTEVGVPYGTSTYAAPEQAQGLRADHRADIFSTGVLLYEMLAGTWPFRGKTALDVRYAVVYHQPKPIIEARNDDSPSMRRIQEILEKALAKAPEDRYQKIEDMRSDLQEVLREIDVDTSIGNTLTDASFTAAARWSVSQRYWTTPRKLTAAGLGLALILALSFIAFRANRTSVETDSGINSLAVLPFTNTDPNSEYLSDGITESLIDSLSRVPNLKVKSSSTVFHYKGRETDPKKIGRELGVHALLSGSVSQVGDDLSVSVELIDVRDDSHIWGERYGRKVSEVVALPQQISRDVSQRLRSRADNMDHAQLTRNYSPDSEAYRLYLQGRYNWNKRTVEGFKSGIDYFGQAILRDQDYALAYAGLADCYLLLNVYNVTSADESYPKAEAASRKALSINESLAEAHTSLAFVTYRYRLKWAEAEEHFKKAIALNPNYATAHQWYASYLAALGRHDEAVVEAKMAHDLEPFSFTIYSDYIRGLYYAGRLDEAHRESLKLVEMDPRFARAHYELGLVLEEQGKLEEAIAEFKLGLKYLPDNVTALTALGHAQARAGKKAEAEKMISRLQELSKQQYVSPFQTAVVYAGLDERKQALDWLEKARDERFNWLPFIKVDPVLKNLRSEPRFIELARSLGLP
ncbi:MAG TPA: protein kinase [Pyrinomonadaceae bacterium]|jgi:serine/threonine-protein kinase|nr:protein kinase [Pyrinomonadaceae bacterium]